MYGQEGFASMVDIKLIADIFGTAGMLFFLGAEVRQFCKIRKTGKLAGISFHAYLSKLIAVLSTGVCFALSGLQFSLLVIVGEGIVIMPVLYWLWQDRNKWRISSPEKFLKEVEKW